VDVLVDGVLLDHEVRLREATYAATLPDGPLMNTVVVSYHSSGFKIDESSGLRWHVLITNKLKTCFQKRVPPTVKEI
jgi:hypothetical protein